LKIGSHIVFAVLLQSLLGQISLGILAKLSYFHSLCAALKFVCFAVRHLALSNAHRPLAISDCNVLELFEEDVLYASFTRRRRRQRVVIEDRSVTPE